MVRTKAGSAAVRKGKQENMSVLGMGMDPWYGISHKSDHLFPHFQLLLLKLQGKIYPPLVRRFHLPVEVGLTKRKLRAVEAIRSRCGPRQNGNRNFTRSWVSNNREAAVRAQLVRVHPVPVFQLT